MALHTQNQSDNKNPSDRQASEEPAFRARSRNPEYVREDEDDYEEDVRRTEAPGGHNGRRHHGKQTTLEYLVAMRNNVQITKDIQGILDQLRESARNGAFKGVTDFKVEQCSSPKSVFAFRARTKSGSQIAVLGVFSELVSAEIPQKSPRSQALNLAIDTYRVTDPDLRFVGFRVYTQLDVQTCANVILDDIVGTLNTASDEFVRDIEMDTLMEGNPQFVTETNNLEAIAESFRRSYPEAVLPAMNAGMTISFRKEIRREGGRDNRQEAVYDNQPVVTIAAVVDFMELNHNPRRGRRGRDVEPRFMPRIRITAIDPIAPVPGLVMIALAIFIDKFVYNEGWRDVFFRDNMKRVGNPGNLFVDPDNTAKWLEVDPEKADEFWDDYYDEFSDPMVALDVEFGRKTVPFLYSFSEVASNTRRSDDAAENIVRAAEQFFGSDVDFAGYLDRAGGNIASLFTKSHTGIVSLKDHHHVETREITFLSAMAGIVTTDPTEEAASLLLRPNMASSADQADQIIRDWLGENVLTPLTDTTTVVIAESLVQAFAQAVKDYRLTVLDGDYNRSRSMFSGRNNIDSYSYRGSSVGVFSDRGMGRGSGRASRDGWSAYTSVYR